jgi:hypothetical protein
MSSYEARLKQALQAQEEDLVGRESAPLIKRAVQFAVQERREDSPSSKPVQRQVSSAQAEQMRLLLDAEQARREVMKQEISSIHCSGTRDKNTR